MFGNPSDIAKRIGIIFFILAVSSLCYANARVLNVMDFIAGSYPKIRLEQIITKRAYFFDTGYYFLSPYFHPRL